MRLGRKDERLLDELRPLFGRKFSDLDEFQQISRLNFRRRGGREAKNQLPLPLRIRFRIGGETEE